MSEISRPKEGSTGIRPITVRSNEKDVPKSELPDFGIENKDGNLRISIVSEKGGKHELPLNLQSVESARAVSKFVRRALVTKETCLSLAALERSCSVYAEGGKGMGQSILRVDDDAFLSGGNEKGFSGWMHRTFGEDTVLADGWNLRSLLGNPDNDAMAKILSASPNNKGKTIAQIMAEFLESVPVTATPKNPNVRAR